MSRRFQKNSIFLRTLTYVSLVLFVISGFYAVFDSNQKHVQAATNNTINFQARILTAAGDLVPDGSYNVQFNLYYNSGGGTIWTETYLNSATQGITTKNGYVTTSLGSLTAFSGINWDQELNLGITIRGTGSCAWASCTPADNEMTPRMKVTSVPYAFRASQLAVYNAGSGFTSTLGAVNPTVGNQTFSLPNLAAATSATLITSGNLADITGVGTLTAGSWHATTIDVDHGGTGATTFTQYGVLYGNGTSAIGVTTVGSTGQCLVSGNGTASPGWGSCSGSGGVTSAGGTTNRVSKFSAAQVLSDSSISDDGTTVVMRGGA